MIFGNKSIQNLGIIVADYDMNGMSSDEENDELHRKERELIIKSLFPPIILKELSDYQTLRNSSFVYDMRYLEKHSHCIYVILRKLISFVYRILYKLLA